MIPKTWTEERISLLKKLWEEGASANRIAEQIGTSRNAVIGKVHRLGLSKRESPIKRNPQSPSYSRKRKSQELPPSPSKGITILDLTERMCRWPKGDPGDPDFQFCGGKVIPGAPYCATHAAQAYQPSRRDSGSSNLKNRGS